MAKHINLLLLLTSGTFKSSNSFKWFNLFNKNPEYSISILIQECDLKTKAEFTSKFGNFYNVIYFKKFEEIQGYSHLKKLAYIRSISKQIDQIQPEVIHIHGLFYTYMVKPLFFLKSKPKIIYNIWGSDFNIGLNHSLKKRLILKWIMRRADLIWTNWYAMGDYVKEKFPKHTQKIRTIPWGVERSLFNKADKQVIDKTIKKFNIKRDQFLMFYARAFSNNSNQEKLLRALANIKRSYKYKLILQYGYANPSWTERLSSLVKELKLADKVLISDKNISDAEVHALYELSDLTFSLTAMEQFSRTISEAILSHTNLILNSNPSYIYLKENFGFQVDLVDVNDIEQLAKKIEYYLRNKPEPDWTFEKMALERLLNFDNKLTTFTRVYQNLIST